VVVVDLGGTKCDYSTRTSLEHTWSVHYEWRMSAIKTKFILIYSVKKILTTFGLAVMIFCGLSLSSWLRSIAC
jgi:hypothetical protein